MILVLRQINILGELIRLLKMTLKATNNQVKVEDIIFDEFISQAALEKSIARNITEKE